MDVNECTNMFYHQYQAIKSKKISFWFLCFYFGTRSACDGWELQRFHKFYDLHALRPAITLFLQYFDHVDQPLNVKSSKLDLFNKQPLFLKLSIHAFVAPGENFYPQVRKVGEVLQYASESRDLINFRIVVDDVQGL